MMEQNQAHISPERLISYDREFLLGLYERMALIREFEEQVKYLFLSGSMPGTIHQCQGQEATAVGVCAALAPEDYITSTHRPHGHALAKGLTPREMLDELFGKAPAAARARAARCTSATWRRGCRRRSPSWAAASRWRPAWRWRSRCRNARRWWPASSATAPSPRAPFTRGSTWRRSGTCRSFLPARTTCTAHQPTFVKSPG